MSRDDRGPTPRRFVDAAALLSLEDSPTEHSTGSFAWLKGKKKTGEVGWTKKAENVEKAGQRVNKATNKASKSAQNGEISDDFDSLSEQETINDGVGASSRTFQNTMDSDPKFTSHGSTWKSRAQWTPETDDGYFTPSPISTTATNAGHSFAPVAVATDNTGASSMSRNPFHQATQPASPSALSGTAVSLQPSAHPKVTEDWWKGIDDKKAMGSRQKDLSSFDSYAWADREVSSSHAEASSTRPQAHSPKANILVQEKLGQELPPPYSEKQREKAGNVRYPAVSRPGRQLGSDVRPPTPVSPVVTSATTGQGDIRLVDLPIRLVETAITPRAAVVHDDVRLPDRPIGTFLPEGHGIPIKGRGAMQHEERRRRRHEKEDVLAYKIGGFWRGRDWVPEHSYLSRPGREGRKRRRVALGLCCLLLALIILGIVLGLVLGHRRASASEKADGPSPAGQPVNDTQASPWLAVHGFPPVPMGVLTVIGPNNTAARSTCVTPPTLWSCALPPEQAPDVLPYGPDQPTFVLQIQYDNNTRAKWDVPPGVTPTPVMTSARPSGPNGQGILATYSPKSASTSRPQASTALFPVRRGLQPRDSAASKYDPGINPDPEPPSFGEMWFLGNTTDGIVSADKAGESTPFYITFLTDANATQGSRVLSRRAGDNPFDANPVDLNTTNPLGPIGPLGADPDVSDNNGPTFNFSTILPPPEVTADGTGAPARLVPHPVQQPLRLFDRGLPSEHYGFYSYFNKTIYVQDTTTETGNPILDATGGGGSPQAQALTMATFGFVRFHVQIWTNRTNTTHLMAPDKPEKRDTVGQNVRPGTFPYPITLTVDMHGGPQVKYNYQYAVGDGQTIDRNSAGMLIVNMTAGGGTMVNEHESGNPTFGGYDGGSGGCECQYQNFA